MDALTNLILFLGLLLGTYFTGTRIEARHYRLIRKREQEWAGLPAINFETLPPGWQVRESELLVANVVVSVDYFKRFLAGLRMIVGGRIKGYEPLLDRARREALLRLKAQALAKGHHAILNVRLETSRMANGRNGEGTAGVEVLAFGTGLVLAEPPA